MSSVKINEDREIEIGKPVDFSFKQVANLRIFFVFLSMFKKVATIIIGKGNMRDKEVRKAVVDFHVNETTTAEAGTPVDFSFNSIKQLKGVGVEGPRSTRIGRIPERGVEHRKYLTRSIWLNNNKLTDIRDVDSLVNTVLEQPEKLGWIDFSFNFITEIDESILKFPNLKIVYFHGNMIQEMSEVFKLRGLPKLRSITFHGNPISDDPKYRMFVITYLPQVLNIDFSPVTNAEKLQPKPPEAVRKIMLAEGGPQNK